MSNHERGHEVPAASKTSELPGFSILNSSSPRTKKQDIWRGSQQAGGVDPAAPPALAGS